MSPPSRVHPQQALAVYAEPLAVRRRVVVFGDEQSVSERLVDLGARQVVTIRPGEDQDDLRPASFDLALVLDLGLFEQPDQLLSRVRRLVGEGGTALVAAANCDVAGASERRAFDYYELFDLVAREFGEVRMIAQLGFHGVALAELGTDDDSPAVSVDTQLMDEQRAPESFIALASQRGVQLDAYTIVELPAPDRQEHDSGELEAARSELAQERLRAQALAGQVDELEANLQRTRELEREVAARGQLMAELSAEVEGTRAAAEAGAVAAAQVEEVARRADRAERALAQVEPDLTRVAEAHAAELAAFEVALQERARTIRNLEGEVARRDRMVRELVSALEEHAGPPAPAHVAETPAAEDTRISDAALEENSRLRARLDAMALDLARRQAEAEATGWTVQELERRLAEAGSRPATAGPPPDAEPRLAAALDELDALRKALTLEHEQRVRAEAALKRPAAADLEPPPPPPRS